MTAIIGLPSPIVYGAKWLLKHPDVLISPLLPLYDYVQDWVNTDQAVWRYAAFRFLRLTPAGTEEDVAQFGINIVNITNGNVDSSWTTEDYVACEQELYKLIGVWAANAVASHTLTEIRWYNRTFNSEVPMGEHVDHQEQIGNKPWRRFGLSGPPAHISGVNSTGASAQAATPYQTALSITLKTATRRHWGRVYLPGLGSGDVTYQYGRFSNATVNAFADAAASMVAGLYSKNFQVVVPATQLDSKFAFALNGVQQVQVDDIPDVIRRRRPKQAAIRRIGVPS